MSFVSGRLLGARLLLSRAQAFGREFISEHA
jgi:hypothetical protein